MTQEDIQPSQKIAYLISGHINSSLSIDEKTELRQWIAQHPDHASLFVKLTNASYRTKIIHTWDAALTEKSLTQLKSRLVKKSNRPRWPYAAAVVILALIGITYTRLQQVDEVTSKKISYEIKPGSNKATLTLANGSKIDLATASLGQLANQSDVLIHKTAEGKLLYDLDKRTSVKPTLGQNIISTPAGGQFQLQLPDGTKVWLNASSSLKYPASFSGLDLRQVELNGEAYFEVAHDQNHPFFVKTTYQTIRVLGTHFNVNSYIDENRTITTLAQGSIQVSDGTNVKMIAPGEQAMTSPTAFVLDRADLETALAWKNGELLFKNADIQTIMRQVSRWYNVSVKYEGPITKRTFSGSMPRNSNLSALLKVLALNDIHVEINGRALTIKT